VEREFTEGITGKDVVGNTIEGVRNAFFSLIRGVGQIVPGILNAASSQRFSMVERSHPLSGTTNAIGNVWRTLWEGNIPGAASALVFELTDGFSEDIMNLLGGAQTHIRAEAA